MSEKISVVTIVGTRPEIIRLSRVIALFDQHVRHVLVHTGQNYDYELNEIFFEQLGLRRPDYYLDAAGGTPADLTRDGKSLDQHFHDLTASET